jgi:hypothetical protein
LLEGNDHNQKHKSNREMDPFSRIMFGNRKPRETYKESENISQEILEQKEQLSFDTRSNHNDDDWFFGRGRKKHISGNQNRQKQTQNTQNQIENFINNVEGENISQEILEQKEQLSFDTRSNHNDDDWFFGRGRKKTISGNQNRHKQTQNTQNQIENFINNVDIGLLMETFDTIVATSKQFKPLMNEVAPFFSEILKKFKK